MVMKYTLKEAAKLLKNKTQKKTKAKGALKAKNAATQKKLTAKDAAEKRKSKEIGKQYKNRAREEDLQRPSLADRKKSGPVKIIKFSKEAVQKQKERAARKK